ncbi:hypothetical protein [Bdellovibrio sp. HCB209]|uniref:hypothetical protein n=1 Tax=Bdellovibrio sp. HCB209 TaxID=3394354 RepID=UPI0039B5E2D0
MRILLLIVIFITMGAATFADSNRVAANATVQFSDGTVAEIATYSYGSGSTRITQIKDASGVVCYAINASNNAAPSVSCTK